MTVIPAINASTFEEARKKIEIAVDFAEWVHIDIADGTITPNVLWGSPQDVKKICKTFPMTRFEAHLMVSNPLENLGSWFAAGISRVVAHAEVLSIEESNECARIARSHGKKFLIAIFPQTDPRTVLPYLKEADGVFALSVDPGLSGQKFQERALETVKFFHDHAPKQTIEVDGGVDDVTAPRLKAAGATTLVAASYIFNHSSPKVAFHKLQRQ